MVCVSNHEDTWRRVRRTAQIYTGSAWVELPVDGDQKLVYDRWNVIQVLDANNGDAVVRTYTWGLDLSGLSGDGSVEGVHGAGGIGGLLAVEVPQATGESRKYGYLYDGNGNVVQLVAYQNASETATLATHYEYDAYGRTAYTVNYDDGSAAAANPFRFSTKWLEDQTSANGFLYYFGYRYYSPRLGRWISRDPIGERGGINRHSFVGNRPSFASDPWGLFEQVIDVGGAWYWGFGWNVGVQQKRTERSCCLNGQRGIEDSISLRARVEVGIGVGGSIDLGYAGSWSLLWKGPQIPFQATAECKSGCITSGSSGLSYCEVCGAIGLNFTDRLKASLPLNIAGAEVFADAWFHGQFCYRWYDSGPSCWAIRGCYGLQLGGQVMIAGVKHTIAPIERSDCKKMFGSCPD